MKEHNKTIFMIIAVTMVFVLIGGGTYAYWQWIAANNTTVSFQVTGGTLSIDGGGNITTKTLAPAACSNTKYAIQRKIKVTAVNQTTTSMLETIQLKVNALAAASGHTALNTTNKASLLWALVRSDATQHAASTWLSTDCSAAVATTNLTTKGTMLAKGNFSSVTAGSTITLYSADVAAAKATNSTTAPDVTTTFYYELYIWIDPAYTGTATVGTSSTDALQDMTLNLAWQGSMTNQPTT